MAKHMKVEKSKTAEPWQCIFCAGILERDATSGILRCPYCGNVFGDWKTEPTADETEPTADETEPTADETDTAANSHIPRTLVALIVVIIAVVITLTATRKGAPSPEVVTDPEPGAAKSIEETDDDGKASVTDENEEPAPESKYAALIGTWTGKLEKPDADVYCYGGNSMPLVLNVKEVSEIGMVTADIHVCQHNHYDLENSAPSTEGDTYADINDVTMTFDDFDFKYVQDTGEKYADRAGPLWLSIEFHVSGMASDEPSIWATVENQFGKGLGYSTGQTDYYDLEKTE